MCNIYRRAGAVFCTFGVILMFMAGLLFNVSAADSNNGTLTMTCKQDDFGIAGMTWQLYDVGEKRGNNYVLTGDFADYFIDLSKIMEDSESMTEAASTLSNYAVLDDIYPDSVGRTNGYGVVQFSGLESGLYLAVGNKVKIDSVSYFPTPFLFEINGESKTINAYPKFITKYTLPGQTDRFTLRKIWANASLVTDKPPALSIQIYEDGDLFDTIQLTEEDNWTYSWEGDASSEWRVKEVNVPPGCFVMYRNNEVQFVIMNSYDNDLLAMVTTTTTTTTVTSTTTTVTPLPATESKDTTTTTQFDDSGDFSRTTTTTTVIESSTTTTQIDDSGDFSRTTSTTTTATGVLPATSTVDSETTTTTTTDSDSTTSTATTSTSTERTSRSSSSRQTSRNTTVTTSSEKLPQTGQLWWPVPVMLFSGLIFIAVGARLLLNSRKED
ncbi:MAG: hypothetical protein NC340_07625 [Ruminococcus flavefaciens]|nr:hypothetical protein [Ruminococcus flavefaciens]MCM1229371.1 hypothetical protein [Ruminococcus flavefaciens]